MRRMLSIYLPYWDTQLMLRQRRGLHPHAARENTPPAIASPRQKCLVPSQRDARQNSSLSAQHSALLLTAEHHGQTLVARCCPTSHRAGAHPGMTLAHAQAIVPHADVAPFDPADSLDGLDTLARWLIRYSPSVAIDPTPTTAIDPAPDGLILDLTGAAHLFGGEPYLLHELTTRLSRAGFTARLALAPTIGAAWALARYAPDTPIVAGASRPCSPDSPDSPPALPPLLAPLPIAALRLDDQTLATLARIGIDTIAHLLAIPRGSLAPRFGTELLLRLDQALGRTPETFTPLRPIEPLTVERIFDGHICQLEPLLLTVQDLISHLCQQLEQREAGVLGLQLDVFRIDAPPLSLPVTLGRPSRKPRHLWMLLKDKIERLNMGFGVEALTLTAHWLAPLRHRQNGLLPGESDGQSRDDALRELLDTLTNHLGRQQVLLPSPTASHVPERAHTFAPEATSESPTTVRSSRFSVRRTTEDFSTTLKRELPTLHIRDRPTILFDHPEPITHMLGFPDHPPARLIWRNQEHQLTAGIGPERIHAEWWHSPHDPITTPERFRDYYKVRSHTGAWLWLFRTLPANTWFIQGLW